MLCQQLCLALIPLTVGLGARTVAPAGLPRQEVPLPFGVNIHFTSPRPGEMGQLAAGGFKLVRMDFAWGSVEREKGVYDFSAYDTLMAALKPHGIRPLFILDYSNRLYEPEQSVRSPEGRAAFAAFAAAAAKHFGGQGVIWEIWNEPNLQQFWRPQPAADDYASLVLETVPAIRKADPKATVLAPASSGFPWEFLETIFKRGVLGQIDAVSVHPYRQEPPETAGKDYARLRELIAKYAPAGKPIPIVSGEWGYSLHHYGGRPISAEMQAQYLVRQWLFNMLEGVPISIWYDWHDDGPDPNETEHNFGTVTYDYKPKQSYIAAQTLTKELAGFRLAGRIDLGTPDDYALVFQKGRTRCVAAWTTGEPHQVRIPARGRNAELITMLGKRSRVEINPRLRASAYDVELSGSPVYLKFDGTTAPPMR